VYLGPGCEDYLAGLEKDLAKKPGVPKEELERLKKEIATVRGLCLNFYIAAASEMKRRLPLTNKLFKEMSFLDPKVLLSTTNRETFPDLSTLGFHFKVSTKRYPLTPSVAFRRQLNLS